MSLLCVRTMKSTSTVPNHYGLAYLLFVKPSVTRAFLSVSIN